MSYKFYAATNFWGLCTEEGLPIYKIVINKKAIRTTFLSSIEAQKIADKLGNNVRITVLRSKA